MAGEEGDEGLRLIELAITEARRAGAFWKAARLNPNTAATWGRFGVEAHMNAARLLEEAMKLSAGGAGLSAFQDEG